MSNPTLPNSPPPQPPRRFSPKKPIAPRTYDTARISLPKNP